MLEIIPNYSLLYNGRPTTNLSAVHAIMVVKIMSIGMDGLTAEHDAVLKATVDYIVDTVNDGTEYDNFSILPEMIREYRKLRKELF